MGRLRQADPKYSLSSATQRLEFHMDPFVDVV